MKKENIFIDEEKREKYNVGGMWEESDWEIISNNRCSSYGGGKPCKHCKILPFEPRKRSDGSVYNENEKEWICPRVIIAENEGGFNSTGLCADCVLEVLINKKKSLNNPIK